MPCLAGLVRTDVSEECNAFIIRVTRIGELRTMLAVTRNKQGATNVVFLRSELWLLVTAKVPSSLILVSLVMEDIRFFETSDLTRATRRNIPEDGILH
jgi:hypothetical protein